MKEHSNQFRNGVITAEADNNSPCLLSLFFKKVTENKVGTLEVLWWRKELCLLSTCGCTTWDYLMRATVSSSGSIGALTPDSCHPCCAGTLAQLALILVSVIVTRPVLNLTQDTPHPRPKCGPHTLPRQHEQPWGWGSQRLKALDGRSWALEMWPQGFLSAESLEAER